MNEELSSLKTFTTRYCGEDGKERAVLLWKDYEVLLGQITLAQQKLDEQGRKIAELRDAFSAEWSRDGLAMAEEIIKLKSQLLTPKIEAMEEDITHIKLYASQLCGAHINSNDMCGTLIKGIRQRIEKLRSNENLTK